VVLVGSNLLGLYLQRQLVQRGLNHINLRFLTFIDLAAAWPLNPGSGRVPASSRYGDLVLISSLAGKIQEGNYFGPIADRRGFSGRFGGHLPRSGRWGVETLPLWKPRKVSELNALYQDTVRSPAGVLLFLPTYPAR